MHRNCRKMHRSICRKGRRSAGKPASECREEFRYQRRNRCQGWRDRQEPERSGDVVVV